MLDKKSSSWSKLEFPTSKFQLRSFSKPKSSVGLRRSLMGGSLYHMNTSPQIYSSARTLQTPSSPLRPLTAPSLFSPRQTQQIFKVEGISQKQLTRIYEAKCKDLKILPIPDQMRKFFAFCEKAFKDRKFDLRECGIGPITADTIGEILRNNPNFCRLELAKNAIGDEGLKALFSNVMKNHSLVHIDLSSNDITPEGAKPILLMATKHPSIISVDISSHEGLHRNRLGVQGSAPLKILLQRNRLLNFLNVSGTFIGEGVMYIIDGLQGNTTLISLNLAKNNISAKNIELLCKAIMGSRLQDINLSDNKFGNEGADYISKMIAGAYDGQSPIKKIDLSKNEITHKGACKLLLALRNNPNINSLSFEGNPLTHLISPSLINLLLNNSEIKFLNLGACQLKNEGVYIFADALSRNNGLRTLILSNNQIEDEGVAPIAEGLFRNYILVSLDLSNNLIKKNGSLLLVNALKNNQTLEKLNLKENNLKDESAQLFTEVLRLRPNLLNLNLDSNPITTKFIKDINVNLKRNRSIFQHAQTPKLKQEIIRLQLRDDEINRVHERIEFKKKEHSDITNKLEKVNQKYLEIKSEEEEKIWNLKSEREDLKRKNVVFSQQLEDLAMDVNKARIEGDKEINECADQIALVVSDTKKLEKKKQALREEFMLKRSQFQSLVDQLNEANEKVDYGKRIAKASLDNLVQKIETMRQEMNKMSDKKQDKGDKKGTRVLSPDNDPRAMAKARIKK